MICNANVYSTLIFFWTYCRPTIKFNVLSFTNTFFYDLKPPKYSLYFPNIFLTPSFITLYYIYMLRGVWRVYGEEKGEFVPSAILVTSIVQAAAKKKRNHPNQVMGTARARRLKILRI